MTLWLVPMDSASSPHLQILVALAATSHSLLLPLLFRIAAAAAASVIIDGRFNLVASGWLVRLLLITFALSAPTVALEDAEGGTMVEKWMVKRRNRIR